MSVLLILLPPRDRLGTRAAAADAAAPVRLPAEWHWVLSSDGRTVDDTGRSPTALLPRAHSAMLVLAEGDVSWHRVDVPKAPASRLRAALSGVLEDALLDDEPALHLALGPGAAPGRNGFVAATHRGFLAAAIAALEAAGHGVPRVVATATPLSAGARGHFHTRVDDDADAPPWLTLADGDGVACVRLGGALARALQPAADVDVRWTATPAAAVAAERWLGAPVAVWSDAERALEAAGSDVNLRQFELAPRTRGMRALGLAARRLLSREWRALRIGLLALVVLQLVGLNAYAWQQRRALDAQRMEMEALLRSAHPGVRAVLDAPLQMVRETERLRAAAGVPGAGDLEALLAAAAGAWPDGQGPVRALRFEPGRLALAADGFGDPQLVQFRERLRNAGYVVEIADGRVVVTRAPAEEGLP